MEPYLALFHRARVDDEERERRLRVLMLRVLKLVASLAHDDYMPVGFRKRNHMNRGFRNPLRV